MLSDREFGSGYEFTQEFKEMAATVDELRVQVMGLTPSEREALALDLLDSVESDDDEVDDSMADVIAERSAAFHAGKLVTHDWKETIAEMRQWLDERQAAKS